MDFGGTLVEVGLLASSSPIPPPAFHSGTTWNARLRYAVATARASVTGSAASTACSWNDGVVQDLEAIAQHYGATPTCGHWNDRVLASLQQIAAAVGVADTVSGYWNDKVLRLAKLIAAAIGATPSESCYWNDAIAETFESIATDGVWP